jgi:hypothetical protein
MTDERFQELLCVLTRPEEPMSQLVRLELALRHVVMAGGKPAETSLETLVLRLEEQDERGAHHEQRATV